MLWGIHAFFSGSKRIWFFLLYTEGEPVNQRLGGFLMRPVNNAVEGLSGNAHALRRVLIIQSLAVRQSHGFQLVSSKSNFVDLAQRNSSGLKIIRGRAVFDSSGTGWPRHVDSISHLCID